MKFGFCYVLRSRETFWLSNKMIKHLKSSCFELSLSCLVSFCGINLFCLFLERMCILSFLFKLFQSLIYFYSLSLWQENSASHRHLLLWFFMMFYSKNLLFSLCYFYFFNILIFLEGKCNL